MDTETVVFEVNQCQECGETAVVFGEQKRSQSCQSCVNQRLEGLISPDTLAAINQAFQTATQRLAASSAAMS